VARWGMVIDLDKCTACQACAVACRAENNVPFAGEEEARKGRAILWMNMISVVEGEYPRVQGRFIPMPCQHCDDPPCVKVCPVGATYREPRGHRRPGLHPLHRLPLLHGGLPLHRPLFQLA